MVIRPKLKNNVIIKLTVTVLLTPVTDWYYLLHRIVEYLPVIEKTGIEFMDHLLAMIYVMIHTYKNKHQVHHRYGLIGHVLLVTVVLRAVRIEIAVY